MHDIQCNGTRIQVVQNLAEALRELRDKAKPTYLWVDALCIDQSNDEEKVRQIRNMKLIYGLANTVIVWLGLPQDNTEQAACFLNEMDLERHHEALSDFEQSKLYAKNNDESFEEREERLNTMIKFFSANFVKQTDHFVLDRTARGLLELALRAWLKRVWVMQEIYAARHITVRCGQHGIEWFAFSRLDSIISILANAVRAQFDPPKAENSDETAHYTGSVDPILNDHSSSIRQLVTAANSALSSITGHGSASTNTMNTIRESLSFLRLVRRRREKPDDLEDNPSLSLLELLIRGSHLEASDARDKIYALLGLTSVPTFYGPGDHTGQEGIRIDYKRSIAEVFEEATRFITRSVKKSVLEAHPGDGRSDSSDIDLPPWCPDWRQRDPCPRVRLPKGGAPYLRTYKKKPQGLVPEQPEYNDQMSLLSGVPKLRRSHTRIPDSQFGNMMNDRPSGRIGARLQIIPSPLV